MVVKKVSSADLSTMQFKRSVKKKVTPSLFDTELANRTYWGREDKNDPESKIDPGTLLVMSMMRLRISKAVRKGHLIDVEHDDMAIILSKEFRKELRDYQIMIFQNLMDDGDVQVILDADGNSIIEIR